MRFRNRLFAMGAMVAALAATPSFAQDTGSSGYVREYPPDLTGDRVVDVQDVIELILNWGECKGCKADLNSDGFVDGSDLTILLFNWGA